MKRLLSLVAIAAPWLPRCGFGIAGLRGRSSLWDGRTRCRRWRRLRKRPGERQQTPAWRPAPFGAANTVANMERWYAFTTRAQVFGFETSREIWQAFNRNTAALLVATIGRRARRCWAILAAKFVYRSGGESQRQVPRVHSDGLSGDLERP